jgi:hypothetical protein
MELDSKFAAGRMPYLDGHRWRALRVITSPHPVPLGVGIRDDGTLRVVFTWEAGYGLARRQRTPRDIPLGSDADWVALAGGFGAPLMTLKADGTLWRWDYEQDPIAHPESARAVSMGRRSDWVGLADGLNDAMAVASDGSLWHWQLRPQEIVSLGNGRPALLLGPSRWPTLVMRIAEAPAQP